MAVKSDWVPFSAAMLLTGALALALGTILIPSADGTAETIRSVHEQNGQWMAGASIVDRRPAFSLAAGAIAYQSEH